MDVISKLKDLELLPKQKKFLVNLLYNQELRYLWYVGGFGSGKSFIGSVASIILSYLYPGNRGIICRKTLVDLKATTQKTFFEVLEGEFGLIEGQHYKFDRKDQIIRFDNGSEVIFTGMDDISKVKSLEIGFYWIDEVDEVDVNVYNVLEKRLRNKNAGKRVGFITSNSEGKNRTYRKFVKGKGMPVAYHSKYYTIRASSLENKFLPQDYIDDLLSYEIDKFKRYVLAEFSVFEGQIFEGFDESIHVIDPFICDDGRDIAYGHDHGLVNPTCFLEGRVDHDGNLYIMREHYKPQMAIKQHALIVKTRMETVNRLGKSQPMVASDPSVFSKTQLPTAERPFPRSVSDEYAEQHLHLSRGNNSVKASIDRITTLFAERKVYICSNCTHLIDELKEYRWKKSATGQVAKEEPEKKNDHAVDAFRYLVMMKSPPSRKLAKAGYKTIEELLAEDIRESRFPKKQREKSTFI